MSDPLEPQDDAATPLTEEERSDLILGWITFRAELNEAEQANILQAWQWASARRRNVLDERFLRNLHQKMFGQVWRWAGQFRRTARNIGVDAYRIPAELRQLLGDCRFWIEHQSYEADEIAVRFHHRLVQIHAFPNGNGQPKFRDRHEIPGQALVGIAVKPTSRSPACCGIVGRIYPKSRPVSWFLRLRNSVRRIPGTSSPGCAGAERIQIEPESQLGLSRKIFCAISAATPFIHT